jgi:hypothetical protein
MPLVQQAIERTASPREAGLETCLDAAEEPPKAVVRDRPEMTTFDRRHQRLRDACRPSEVELAEAAPAAKGSEQATESDVVHATIVAPDGLSAVIAAPRLPSGF